MKYLIAGLGNIGSEYAETRHNIGFKVVDALAKASATAFKPDRLADVCEVKHKGRTFILIKPTTYMNLSGKAIKYWLTAEKISARNLLVITDDLALPCGELRLRAKGSDGGHNGLKSIQFELNTNEYPRLRFGVGNNFSKGRQVDYVLGEWTAEEKPVVEQSITKAVELIKDFGSMDIAFVMNKFNKK